MAEVVIPRFGLPELQLAIHASRSLAGRPEKRQIGPRWIFAFYALNWNDWRKSWLFVKFLVAIGANPRDGR